MRVTPFQIRPPAARPVRGVNGAVLDWLYGIDEEKARAAELDARIRALNQRLYEQGKITAQNLADANARLEAQGPETYTAQVDAAFREGAAIGYGDMVRGISAALDAPAKFLWDAVPAWVWLAGLGVIAWKLGAFDIARHQLKQRYAS